MGEAGLTLKSAADDFRVLIPFCFLVLFLNEGVLCNVRLKLTMKWTSSVSILASAIFLLEQK